MKAMLRRTSVAGVLAVLLCTAAPGAYPVTGPERGTAARASQVVLGAGSRPGLAVDNAGTGYIAWNGPENPASLQFCTLPRGASGCWVRHGIAVPAGTTSGSRPFVSVSGASVRVLQYRYPTSGPNPAGVYLFVSADGGATFAAGTTIGTVPFEEGTFGPGDTFSGVPVNGEMAFQNVPLGGGPTVAKAVLSATHQNLASVGLVDAATPLAVFTSDNAAQWRRYDGTGSVNDVANWTPPVDIGIASYPRLAGGPRGLFLLAGDGASSLTVRKFTGSGFGPPVTIGPGNSATAHLFQDASGRLHAVFQRDSANPLRLIHATSDDGVAWRSGTVTFQQIGTDGGCRISAWRSRPTTWVSPCGTQVWGGRHPRCVDRTRDAPAGRRVLRGFAQEPASLGERHLQVLLRRDRPRQRHDQPQERQEGQGRLEEGLPQGPRQGLHPAGVGTTKVKLKLSAKSLKALQHAEKVRFTVTVTFEGTRVTATLKLKAP